VLDYRTAPVSSSDAAMLAYAAKLTRTPQRMDRADVEALAHAGFGDAAILDICQIVAYYNYVNRLADGLGVELEEFWTADDMILSREDFERLRRSRRGATHDSQEADPE
jgi:hypothetical protein